MSLLIVEDDLKVRSALVRAAQRQFSRVFEAANAYEAMTLIERFHPRIVITDWDLGGELTGIDVANYVKTLPRDIRIIFITGKSMSALKTRTAHLTGNYFLAKPFSVTELRTILELCQNESPPRE